MYIKESLHPVPVSKNELISVIIKVDDMVIDPIAKSPTAPPTLFTEASKEAPPCPSKYPLPTLYTKVDIAGQLTLSSSFAHPRLLLHFPTGFDVLVRACKESRVLPTCKRVKDLDILHYLLQPCRKPRG